MTGIKPKASARRTKAKPQCTQVQSLAGKFAEARDPDRSRQWSKLDVIRSLLNRTDGASLNELVLATGWQPHSVRAGMTGLRKQGLSITRTKVNAITRFAIEVQPSKAPA